MKVLLLLLRDGVALRSWLRSKNNVIVLHMRQAFGMLFAMRDPEVFVFFPLVCVNNIDHQSTSSGDVSDVHRVGDHSVA